MYQYVDVAGAGRVRRSPDLWTDTCDPRTRGGYLHRTGTSRDTLSQGDQQTNNTSPSPTPQIQFLHPTSILGHAAASTPLHRESMEMQGYCIVGTHSGFALKKQPGLVMPSWRWEKGGKASLLPGAELSLRFWSGNAKVRCPHCSRQLSRQQTCNQCLTRLRVFVLKCNP